MTGFLPLVLVFASLVQGSLAGAGAVPAPVVVCQDFYAGMSSKQCGAPRCHDGPVKNAESLECRHLYESFYAAGCCDKLDQLSLPEGPSIYANVDHFQRKATK